MRRHIPLRPLLAGLALAGVMTTAAPAADTIVHVVTYVEVVPAAAPQSAVLLRQYREAAGKEAGLRQVEVLQRIDRPNQFVVLAVWADQKAFEAHGASAPAAGLRTGLHALLASPNDERVHTGLAVGPPAAGGVGALHAVTHVDVIPPRKDDSLPLLRQLAEDSRRDPGNLRFDVVQQTNRPNHFTVVEVWRDRSAFDAHGAAAHTRRFREQLAPMSGSLYDERLYGELR
jgi:quinol monooxygenase YgiN